MWERGRSDGIALALQMVERLLCDEGREITEGQEEILLALYDLVFGAKFSRNP